MQCRKYRGTGVMNAIVHDDLPGRDSLTRVAIEQKKATIHMDRALS